VTELTKIRDVWGDEHYVSTADLADTRKVLIPLFKKDGTNKKSRQGFPTLQWKNVKISRDNIAQIG
jgi:hypothetical protein